MEATRCMAFCGSSASSVSVALRMILRPTAACASAGGASSVCWSETVFMATSPPPPAPAPLS
jgi:hypothetical protein